MSGTSDFAHLYTARDEDLIAILAAADAADIALHHPANVKPQPPTRSTPSGTCEVLLLGALGCRYGMLAGGAGGHLIRTATTTVLVDPGPAALGVLLQLTEQGLFHWSELDAIAVTHLHPDHYADVIPCLEGMVSYSTGGRKLLLANPTSAARFAAFSPSFWAATRRPPSPTTSGTRRASERALARPPSLWNCGRTFRCSRPDGSSMSSPGYGLHGFPRGAIQPSTKPTGSSRPCSIATCLTQQVVYSVRGLSQGSHTLRGVKRSGTYMLVDRFDVIP
ncbi:MBL fold metallo-hydrolase [Streptosporangium sp. NPDC002524]|uniref:MBL fold metallo-hydrolase n=1 Tax=Streptosporangium sp. NPDC002524 TaxID=3154537 RepID=UPI0033171070